MGGTAASMEVVGGTIRRIGELGGTAASMGKMEYPYRVLVTNVREDKDYITG